MRVIAFPVKSSGFADQACLACLWARPTASALVTRFLPGAQRPRLQLARNWSGEYWTAILSPWITWGRAGLRAHGTLITPLLCPWTAFPSASRLDAASGRSMVLFLVDAANGLAFLAAALKARAT